MEEALNSNSFTKEIRPPTGEKKSSSQGFGIGTFGSAVFGATDGYEQDKEALKSNSLTKAVLVSNSLTDEALESNSFTKEALPSKI